MMIFPSITQKKTRKDEEGKRKRIEKKGAECILIYPGFMCFSKIGDGDFFEFCWGFFLILLGIFRNFIGDFF
jgi:hypothetical protein